MAVLRRRRLVLLVLLASVLLSAAILSTYYTVQDQRVIVSGDGPLLINDDDGYNGQRSEEMSAGARMVKRKKRLKTECAKMKEQTLSPPNQHLYQHEALRHLIISKEKQVLYCYLPKVANTNFRRVFLGLQGDVPISNVPNISGYEIYFTHDKKFKYVNEFNRLKQSELLHKYRKFLFVRDPLERLLSGYRNKFFHPNARHKAEYHDRAADFYKRHPHLRKRNDMRVDFRSKEMSFKEFLIYWSDVFEAKEYLNEHFVASNQLCNPCNIQYDYIGKYETLKTDVKFIFDKLNIDIEFPGRNDNYSSVETSSLVENFYRPMPSWLLKKTWEIIKFDYLIFDYQLPGWYKIKIRDR